MSHAFVPPRAGAVRDSLGGELLLRLVIFLMKPGMRCLRGAASGMRLQKLSRRLLAR